jgi:general secretion pathway protein G
MRPASGFTLIELLICAAIVAILATVAMPLSELKVQREKERELRTALRDIRSALDAYKKAWDEGRIPKSADESGYPATLAILVDGVNDVKSPNARKVHFLRRVPRDPMADLALTPEATWGKRSYESPADAPREGKDVYDVFSLSEKAGLNGIPYRQW